MKLRVLNVFGTRPEAIKMIPVIYALSAEQDIETLVCVTYQHREMLNQVLDLFCIKVDFKLDAMLVNQSISRLVSGMLDGLQHVMTSCKPDLVLVHGDTSTCLAGALAAFYNKIPVVHIEAGLRTGNLDSPFPEEAHRQLVSRIANLHLVPTHQAARHLLAENIGPESVHVTGNTVVDALRLVQARLLETPDRYFAEKLGWALFDRLNKNISRMVLLTLHRRELSGEKFTLICEAILNAARKYPDWTFVYPVHLNPSVHEPAGRILGNVTNIHLFPPLDYLTFIWLMVKSDLVVTDSGGVQEEAEILGKRLMVVRDHTDRPEMMGTGGIYLAGTRPEPFAENLDRILAQKEFHEGKHDNEGITSIFGDGYAARKIVGIIRHKYMS